MNFIDELTAKEFARQRDTLNLIASENYPSAKTLSLLGSVWSNKYAEGYPGKRYYAGNINSDELETFVQQKALQLFDPTKEYGVNVQVLSGSPANAMVYFAALEQGDTILSLDLPSGGHLSHLHDTSNYKKFFKHYTYGLAKTATNTYEIDIDDYRAKLRAHKPKLTIVGFSSYPRAFEFRELCRLAHDAGSLVLADIAHINGLVAAGLHDSPFKKGEDGADFVSMTTHKTLRGPRGAMLFAKDSLMPKLNKTVFPGTSGGPHLHQMAAIGQSLLEALGEDSYPDNVSFEAYSRQILATCKTLENSLADNGLEITSPTQTHLCLVRLPREIDSLEIQQKLEQAGIILNRNVLPEDPKPAWRPSGLRLGTATLASRGFTDTQAENLGKLIADLILDRQTTGSIKKQVAGIVSELNWWY